MKNSLKKIIPGPIHSLLRYTRGISSKIIDAYRIRTQSLLHQKAAIELKRKIEPVNIVFFALYKSVWKYDRLYWLLEQDYRFHPIVLVCPVVNLGHEEMVRIQNECYEDFKRRGYRVICSYNEDSDTYMDARSLMPDIIFYTNPYKGLIDDRYYITRFRNILTCYVSYHFGNSSDYRTFNDSLLQNLSWKLFVETNEHKTYYEQYTRRKGSNVIVTGYPGVDRFVLSNYSYSDEWKNKDRSLKRIIWAPHHSFDENCPVHYSTFLRYHQFMIDIAKKYNRYIQIAFRPHPLLRPKLEQYWGKERTDQYFSIWNSLDNGWCSSGDYVDLFLSSDAIMHDSGSFIVEYLYTCKPALRIDGSNNWAISFNPFAQECLSKYYHADCESKIEEFVLNVINGIDPMRTARETFYRQVLLPPNGIAASDNIINCLRETIFEQ